MVGFFSRREKRQVEASTTTYIHWAKLLLCTMLAVYFYIKNMSRLQWALEKTLTVSIRC